MKSMKSAPFYRISDLAKEWDISEERIWSYINFGELPACVHVSSIEQSLKRKTSENYISRLENLDTTKVSQIMRRGMPHLVFGALSPDRHFNWLGAEYRCIQASKAKSTYEEEETFPLPEFLYLNPTILSPNLTETGTSYPSFNLFEIEDETYGIVAFFNASLTSGERIYKGFWVNSDDLGPVGPVGVTASDKLNFELSHGLTTSNRTWKDIAHDMAVVLLRDHPRMKQKEMAETIAKKLGENGIKNDRGNSVTAATTIKDVLTPSGLFKRS